MLTVSPPVSPSVVAAILMIQNTRVTSGTLLRTWLSGRALMLSPLGFRRGLTYGARAWCQSRTGTGGAGFIVWRGGVHVPGRPVGERGHGSRARVAAAER